MFGAKRGFVGTVERDATKSRHAKTELDVRNELVRPEGLEPPTPWSEAMYSIH